MPRIGGQHEAYLVKALQQYKSGERSHPVDARDRGAAVGPGHGRPRRVLRAGRRQDREQMIMRADDSAVIAASLAALRRPPARRAADLARGKAKATEVCAGVPRRRRQQHDAGFPEARRPVSRLSREGAARLQVRPAQEPDHGGIRAAAVEAGHRQPRRVLRLAARDRLVRH